MTDINYRILRDTKSLDFDESYEGKVPEYKSKITLCEN